MGKLIEEIEHLCPPSLPHAERLRGVSGKEVVAAETAVERAGLAPIRAEDKTHVYVSVSVAIDER